MSKKREEPKCQKRRKTNETWTARKARNSKNAKKVKQNQKKIQNGPRSHICQRHQKTEINAGETELAMKLKKIRKAKKTQKPKKRKTAKKRN